MPRKRMVSPELLASESVARLPIPTRYFFVGLWMYLDDEGRGRDNAALICAHQWPLDPIYTPRKVETDLVRLSVDLICRYTVAGQAYLHSPKWLFWQKINHPTPSRTPPCPLELAGDSNHVRLPECYRSPTGVLLDCYGSPPGVLPEPLPHRVVELSREKGSSSGEPSDPTPGGSDGLSAAKQAFGKLGQRKNGAADVA